MGCVKLLALLWFILATGLAALEPKAIAVLYNSADPESMELARFYAQRRAIPEQNLVGLQMPRQAEITREQYEQSIAAPLRKVFDERTWWKRERNARGVLAPGYNRIRVLLCMRGVPLKIRMTPPADDKPVPDRNKQPFAGHDEASVDSELALFGIGSYPLEGAQRSAYFGQDKTIEQAGLPGLVLTCRIEAPTLATSRRMITDAIEVEQTGLWGFHQIDISKKYPQGDDWLENIVKENLKLALPTAVDRFSATLPSHYPSRDLACYYGWYDWNLSGPMLNSAFRFRKGAVAIHIHSYSAQQLRDPKQNWCGGLLEAGAGATVGNVYEPYLGLTHHLDVLHKRLLAGHTWVEASWMALPAVSWQAVTLGDPLYRPFKHLDGSGKVLDGDREYRALRAAMTRWGDKPGERIVQLKQAALRMESGIFMEAIALESLERGDSEKAGTLLVQARELYTEQADHLRQDLQRIAILRSAGQKDLALGRLHALAKSYAELSEVKAVHAWIQEIDPPPKKPSE